MGRRLVSPPRAETLVTYLDDLALKQAERADQELQAKKDRGPLHGIPWGLKDIFAYPGYPTTWGVGQFRDRVIDVKAAVAERLENAGAVLVAKLATNTLAGGSVLWYRGITRNPWNPRRDAGGSSSGPAAAVAAGLVGFSIGTETSASLMGPSIVCGVVGLRATFGRVSRHGCMQRMSSRQGCCQRVGRRVRRPHAPRRSQGCERLASVLFAWPFSNGGRLSEAQSVAGHRHAAI
jgi:Asp-tRNA(Asn)/Glu-tRNA(Gln) amidotransferase A subunit family amidase